MPAERRGAPRADTWGETMDAVITREKHRKTVIAGREPWIALALCAATLAAGVLAQLVHDRPAYAGNFAPDWLPLAAAALAAAGIVVRFIVVPSRRAWAAP